jgi:hypothetical protein
MQIRRPIAALFVALALFGGGSAALSGCGGDPAGLDRRDGTPDDNVSNTSGANPSSDEQDNLPDTSDPDQNNTEDQNDDNNDPD